MRINYEYLLKSYKYTVFDNPTKLWEQKVFNNKLLLIDLMNAQPLETTISNGECCICLEPIKKIYFGCKQCNHKFHKNCFRNCEKCPLCRKNYRCKK